MSDLEAALDLLREHLDIKELVEDLGVEEVYESGSNVYGRCPFHDDRDPSWGIQTDPVHEKWSQWGCFGCQRKGNVASLVRELQPEMSTYKEAVHWLLRRCGLLPADANEAADLALATRLRREPPSRPEPKTVEGWLARFPPVREGSPCWDYLASRGVHHGQVMRAGAREGRGGYSGRVILPILDREGRAVSFYARAIGEAEKKGLYAKRTELGTVLWGMDRVNPFVSQCYLVEGIFDGLAVERALARMRRPVVNVFGALKSTLSEGQATFLHQFEEVIVLPDMKGGGPGLMPSVREALGHKRVYVVEVDHGRDPDSQERAGVLDGILGNPVSAYQTDVRFFVRYTLPGGQK